MSTDLVDNYLLAQGVFVNETEHVTYWMDPKDARQKMLWDGELQVLVIVERDKKAVMLCRVTRSDGRANTADLTFETLEDFRKLNAWFGQHGALLSQVEKKHLPDIKTWIFGQPGAKTNCDTVLTVGFSPTDDVIIGKDGVIDYNGVWHPLIVDVPMDVLCRGEDGKPEMRSLFVDPKRFGTDIPFVPRPAEAGVGPAPGLTGYTHQIAKLPDPHEWTADTYEREQAYDAARFDMRLFMQALHDNYGHNQPHAVMGYLAAHAYSSYLASIYNRFPHLYIYGGFGTGKDVLARTVWEVFGGDIRAVQKAGAGSTLKGLRNTLGANTLLPAWLNELRKDEENEGFTRDLMSFIRSAYDRQASVVTNIRQEKIYFPCVRSLMLVGESVVGMGAESSRYVEIHLSRPRNMDAYARVQEMMPMATRAWSTLLCGFHHGRVYMRLAIDQLEADLRAEGIDDRRAFAWACVGAGVAYLMHPLPHIGTREKLAGFYADLVVMARLAYRQSQEQRNVAVPFWDLCENMQRSSDLKNGGMGRWIRMGLRDGVELIGVHFSGLYTQYERVARRPVDKSLLQNELRKDVGFVNEDETWVMGFRGNDPIRRRVFMFNAERTQLPDWVKSTAFGGFEDYKAELRQKGLPMETSAEVSDGLGKR